MENIKNRLKRAIQYRYYIFDIQDVGVRFYTYLSTLHYVMEAVAKEGYPYYCAR